MSISFLFNNVLSSRYNVNQDQINALSDTQLQEGGVDCSLFVKFNHLSHVQTVSKNRQSYMISIVRILEIDLSFQRL